MPKQVEGFLANDGTFFEDKPECERYEFTKILESLCDSHGTNYENFMAMINAWHGQIEGYYNADKACKVNQAGRGPLFLERDADEPTHDDELPAFLPTEGDIPYAPVGDKDAKGFLEQQVRGYK